jgi:hypothetical protein
VTVSFVSAASAETNTLTMPSHQAGDLLVIWAYRSAANTLFTVPDGWYRATVRSAGSQCSIFAFKTATSSSEASGTWTNADALACCVYRDNSNFISVGGIVHTSINSSTAVVYSALVIPGLASTSVNTMRSSSSIVVGCVGITANNSNVQTAPSGMTNRTSVTGSGARQIAVHDTSSEVANWASTTFTQSQSTNGHVHVVELFDSGAPKSSGGLRFPRAMNGGYSS